MFTGIIQSLGRLESIRSQGERSRIRVDAGPIANQVGIGDSVAVSGICLTAVKIDGKWIDFDVTKTTLDQTRLGQLKNGDQVNLELALKLEDRLGGHMVSGHVDGVGRIRNIDQRPQEIRVTVEAPETVMVHMIERGSVAIDGISLTVAQVHASSFEVAIIPHTWKSTNLNTAVVGDPVNLEADMIGKYVAKHLNQLHGNKGITWNKLSEEGYIR